MAVAMEKQTTEKTKCELCGGVFSLKKGSAILTQDGKIVICPECHDDTFRNGSRYNVDVMVVPISENSFKIAAKKGIYVCPSQYIRKTPKLIAFYRGGEVGAITHISKVVKVASRVPRSQMEFSLGTNNSGSWVNKDRFEVFSILVPVLLRFPIFRYKTGPVQNRMYRTFKQFLRARKLRDLYNVHGA
jgi:Zn finger protein HypA/HybF involved in hydrogenase expression